LGEERECMFTLASGRLLYFKRMLYEAVLSTFGGILLSSPS